MLRRLGKTIELISLVLSNLFDAAVASSRCKADMRLYSNDALSSGAATITMSRATLVIVPLSLLGQWRDEVDKCVTKGHLRVGVWYPFDDARVNQDQLDPKNIPTLDIVLTTYDVSLRSHLNCMPAQPRLFQPRLFHTHSCYFL